MVNKPLHEIKSAPLSILNGTLELRLIHESADLVTSCAETYRTFLKNGVLIFERGEGTLLCPVRYLEIDVHNPIGTDPFLDGEVSVCVYWYDVTLIVQGHAFMLGYTGEFTLPNLRPNVRCAAFYNANIDHATIGKYNPIHAVKSSD